MPSTIDLYQIGVWFAVGVFTGMGWVLGTHVMARLLALF